MHRPEQKKRGCTVPGIWGIDENALYWRIPQILKTWLIIFVGELFFRAEGLRQGMEMFSSMFRGFDVRNLWDGTLLRMGMGQADFRDEAAPALDAILWLDSGGGDIGGLWDGISGGRSYLCGILR